jgi:hypothetical protein
VPLTNFDKEQAKMNREKLEETTLALLELEWAINIGYIL